MASDIMNNSSSSVYEYTFKTVDDYTDFFSNIPLNIQECLIKPIVVKYHNCPNNLVVDVQDNQIIATGLIFEHNVKITYQSDKIDMIFHNQNLCTWGSYSRKEYRKLYTQYNDETPPKLIKMGYEIYYKSQIPDNLPQGRVIGATVIIHFNVPEVVQFLWGLWHDKILPYNDVIDQFSSYVRAFYIPYDKNPNLLLKGQDDQISCSKEVIRKINDFKPMPVGSKFDPLVFHRMMTVACLSWRVYLHVRIYEKVKESILYFPGIGQGYIKASEDFLKQSKK